MRRKVALNGENTRRATREGAFVCASGIKREGPSRESLSHCQPPGIRLPEQEDALEERNMGGHICPIKQTAYATATVAYRVPSSVHRCTSMLMR